MKRLSQSQIQGELKLAGEAYARGDVASAGQRLDFILSADHECGEAHFGKGLVLASQGRTAEALLAFTHAVRCNPNNGEALKSAALTAISLHLPEEAEKFARRLVHAQPGNDLAHFLLSISLGLSSRWDDAIEAIDVALAIQPTKLDYVVGKAQLLAKFRSQILAIEWYRKALEIGPVPQIANELAELLMEESQFEEALSLLERFSSELPPEARPHTLLARAYTESQRFKEAEPHWAYATKFSSDDSKLTEMRARSEIWAGRLDKAEGVLREGLEQDRHSTLFFSLLMMITKMTEADMSMLSDMEGLLAGGNLNAADRQTLNYALGKSYHDVGDYGKAIAFYDEANRLRPEVVPNQPTFDRELWRSEIDFQIEFFTKEHIASWAREGLESNRPLFVLGMIRSGTTLTEQILSGHSQVLGLGESSFWVDHHNDILDTRLRRLDVVSGRRLGKAYLQLLDPQKSGLRYSIDKNPLNVLFAASLHCLFPKAKMVHIKRNAVDNLLSIWTTPMTIGLQFISTREDLVFAYREYLRLAAHLESVLPPDSFKTFAYEEITSDPTLTIGKMLRFLELEPEAGCFHPDKNARTVRTPSMYQVRQPINRNSQEKWKLYEPWLGPFAELLKG